MCLCFNQPLVALRASVVCFCEVQGLLSIAFGSVFAVDRDLVPDPNTAQLVRLRWLRPVRPLGDTGRLTLTGGLGILAAAAETARDGRPPPRHEPCQRAQGEYGAGEYGQSVFCDRPYHGQIPCGERAIVSRVECFVVNLELHDSGDGGTVARGFVRTGNHA